MQLLTVKENENYVYLIKYQPTRPQKQGVLLVERFDKENNDKKVASTSNNPNITVDMVLTNYEVLNYNYLHEL